MSDRTTFYTFLGVLLALLSALLSPLAAQVVTVPVSMTLDAPSPTAPGINNFYSTLTPPSFPLRASPSTAAGSINTTVQLNVADPDNPVIVGIQFTGAQMFFADVAFYWASPALFVHGTGLAATLVTLSGHPEPVVGNTFYGGLHYFQLNQGSFLSSGYYSASKYFAVEPIGNYGLPNSTTSIAKTGSTLTSHTYSIGATLPMSIYYADGNGLILNMAGIFASTGTVTVYDVPEIKLHYMTPAGLDLEIMGNPGTTVDLMASEHGISWAVIDTLTLTDSVRSYTDASALGIPARLYCLRVVENAE